MNSDKRNDDIDGSSPRNHLLTDAGVSDCLPGLSGRPLPSYWSGARLELLAWLRGNAVSLAELYEGAVLLLHDHPFPGRVRFICHAVREIRNRLPEAISGVRGPARLDYVTRLDCLAKQWRQRGLPVQLESLTAPATPDIPLERSLYLEVAGLIREHEQTRSRPEDAARRLFENAVPEKQQFRETLRPILRQWLEITGWFVGRVHDSGAVDADCDEDCLREKFELFERALTALVRPFFSTLKELDEILEDANS